MTPLTRAPVGLEPTRSERCPAHTTGLSATPNGPPHPSRVVGWRVPRHRRGFPCCVHPPLPCVPPPLPRRNRPVRVSLAFRRWQPSPCSRRVGFRIAYFEACSAFTRVAARMVADPPKAALFHRSASGHVVTSITRSDYYRLERQLPGGSRNPLRDGALHGALEREG